MSNKVYVKGTLVKEVAFSHEFEGETFYEALIEIPRFSGTVDVLPITISESLVKKEDLKIGCEISAVGQLRTYNKIERDKSRLILTVFIQQLMDANTDKNPNQVYLEGYICKPPIYRTTPFNREITDVLVAVNRTYNKSDYIPCIAWGRNARFVESLSVGDRIAIWGRLQSRKYQKKHSETEIEQRVAYELSIDSVQILEDGEV